MKRYCNVCIYETLPYKKEVFKKNQMILLEGDTIEGIYRIDSGYVKVLKYHDSGDEKIFDIIGPNDFLALLLVLQAKKTYEVTAIALTDVTLRYITIEDTLDAYQKNPIFQQICMQCAARRATIFQQQLFQVSSADLDEKIMGVLIYLYHKFGRYIDGKHFLDIPINQTELSSIIGIRRETLSRRLTLLQKQGRIRVSRQKYQFFKI